jgi:hypothetical protein
MISKRLVAAAKAYEQAFAQPIPEPMGYDDDRLAELLEEAVAAGKPIDPDADLHAGIPPEANA